MADAITRALDSLPIWLCGVLLFALLMGGAALGRWLRARGGRDGSPGDASLLVSASLGLLALLLGFTVSMAVSRHEMRRSLLVQEANAIDTMRQRADLMPAASAVAMRDELSRYLDARIRVSRIGEDAGGVARARADSRVASERMWAKIVELRASVPEESVKLLLVEGAGRMFDLASEREAALDSRLPVALLALLLLFPVASAVLLGYAYGRSPGIHGPASTEMILLLTLTLLLILDLDRPRSGMILTSQRPLVELQQAELARRAPGP